MSNNFPVLFDSGNHKLLFLDPSASHMAYTIMEFDFDKKEMYLVSAGMIWTKDSWAKGKKYRYMYGALKLLASKGAEGKLEVLVTESFFANPKQMHGSAVVPTINALANMACDYYGLRFEEMGPSGWRKILGIKPGKDTKGKRDYKTPTADYVKKYIKLPAEITSNITNKSRSLPHDVTDVLAIALAVGKHHGLTKVITGNVAFTPFTLTQDLLKLTEEI